MIIKNVFLNHQKRFFPSMYDLYAHNNGYNKKYKITVI